MRRFEHVQGGLALIVGLMVSTMGTGCVFDIGDLFLGGEQTFRDSGIVVLDGGFDRPPDAGEDDAGLELDAGPPPVDGGADAGLDDGGVINVYEGQPEEGVRCGDTLETCAAGAACCGSIIPFPEVSFIAACGEATPAPDAGVCPAMTFPFQCDDASIDCGGQSACCFRALLDFEMGIVDFSTTCIEESACLAGGDSLVCTGSGDCPAGQECCGFGGGEDAFALPLDFGLCQDSCALPDGGIPDAGF